MGDTLDFERARDRAAFENMLERSSYHEKIKPIIREGFAKGYDQAKDRAHQARSSQKPEKIDTRNEGATGAETIEQNGRTLRAKVVASWIDPNPENTRTPSEQRFSAGTGRDSSHSKSADNGGMDGKENLNLFNHEMNRGIFNRLDNQSKEMAQNGDKVFQVTVDYYDPTKEGYGLKQPVYEDRDRMVFPQEGAARHEKLSPINFPNEKSRAAEQAQEQREAAAKLAVANNPQAHTHSATGQQAPTLKVVGPSDPKAEALASTGDAGKAGASPGPAVQAKPPTPGPNPPAKPANAGTGEFKPTRITPSRGELTSSAAKVDAIRETLRQQRAQPSPSHDSPKPAGQAAKGSASPNAAAVTKQGAKGHAPVGPTVGNAATTASTTNAATRPAAGCAAAGSTGKIAVTPPGPAPKGTASPPATPPGPGRIGGNSFGKF